MGHSPSNGRRRAWGRVHRRGVGRGDTCGTFGDDVTLDNVVVPEVGSVSSADTVVIAGRVVLLTLPVSI